MDKLEFFILAMKAGMYRYVDWVIRAFSVIQEAPDAWREDPTDYRIVQTPSGVFFVDPTKDHDLTPLIGVEPNKAPFDPKERVALKFGDVDNLTAPIESYYGNLFFNYQCLVYPFGNKIPYMQGRVTSAQLEKEVLKRYKETPEDGHFDPKAIYTQEYLKFADAVFHLENYMQLFTPAGSEKSMTTHPEMKKLREKLFEENKEHLHDPAVFAQITKELEKLDRDWLKDDPDSMDFYLKAKSFKVVRRKLFETIGSDAGLSGGVEINPVKRSLSEGWDADVFPQLNNAHRAASYSRGAETALGGEQVKWLLRSSSNMVITEKDCGSQLGTLHRINDNHVGFTAITDKGQFLLDETNIQPYLGKVLKLRSSMFCQLPKTDYCQVCVGARLSLNPTSMFTAISKIGDIMLAISLASAHSAAIEVAPMDCETFLT